MSVSILVNVLQSLLHDNVPHVLCIFWVKESCKLLKWQTSLNHSINIFDDCCNLNVQLSTVIQISH